MKKLISMTDFVLNETNSFFNDTNYEPSDLATNLSNYANLLKQPLTLSMFVPTDENGCVLEEPKNYKDWERKALNVGYDLDLSKYETYQQAKYKCIFEGFEYDKKMEYWHNNFISFDEEYIENKTIEDLIPYNLTLTDNVKI